MTYTAVIIQLASGLLSSACYVSLPRRPDVYLDGMLVDRQNCSSAWSAITFSWANDLLQLALTKQSINVEDLPKLPRVARSAYLQPRLDGIHPSRSLLTRIVLVHWPAILLQQILTVAVVCLNFAPQVILLYILRCLESLQSSNSSRVPALAGAMALSSCMVVSSVVDSWLYWLVVYRISIPLREQLSSVIYAKAIRSPVLKSSSRGVPQSKGDASDCETEEAPALDENTINLVAVDSKRVSDQAANNYTITSTFLKFVVACVFLILLLGWVSTLSGLCLVMAITPLNFWLSQRLGRSQTTMMGHRDQRVAVLGEVLRGIREVKLRAHENWWEARISILRRSELRARWMCFLYDLGLMTVCALGPILLSVVSLGIYAVVDGPLTPSVAFSAMGAFASLEASIANLPELVASLIEALVSLRRIGNYLTLPDFQSPVLPSTTGSISFKGAAIAYKADVDMPLQERFVLNNLDFSFPPRALSIVSGKTGSGKSLILSAIMGECEVIRGAVQVPDNRQRNPSTEQSGEEPWIMDTAIAFVPQTPWMDNATVQDNILFGLPYHQSRYQQVISDCSLTEDINSFPQKHLTKVGAHGIHLSGGQKWRLSLARALYSRAGILLLEDIFSAVDVRTALVICDRALTGPLAQGRTRILVTHHLDLYAMLKVEVLAASQYVNKFDAPTGLKIDESEMERNATGWVEMKVYEIYLKAGGDGRLWSLIFLAYISYMILILSRPWWINIWTRDITSTDNLRSPVNQSMVVLDREQSHLAGDLGYYLSVYILISVLSCIAGSIRFFFIFSASLRASRELFNQLLFSVLNAPVEWFDHVPVGRILNRFSTDINLIDSKLGYDIGAMIHRFLEVIGIAISGLFATPLTAIFSLIPIVGGVYYAPRYLVAARDIKRLESSTMSPVLEHFGTSISGLMTIRAFGNMTWCISRMQMLLDRHGQASWHLWLFNRWFNLRMSLTGAIYCALTATLVVLLPGINASIAGFVLSFTIQYPNAVLWSVRQYINVELSMSSTERVMEYENVVIEDQGGVEPPAAWPDAGMLEVQDLSVGYGNLPCVLKGVSFKVGPAEKVAVVGKTGAGKSSLTYAIFRVLEARKGSVLIDGVDISKLRLKELRSRIHIIPQDPIFFSGTIRSNLDPQNQYSDQEMYECLQGLQLFDSDAQSANIMAKEKSYFADLSNTVSANGEGLSFGQRQLLSLCRAFLSRPKLLVFDEATSSLDMATDALIQKFIRQQAARFGTTLLVVAHRLSTVIDFDKIIVFDSGRVVESGPAHELINIDNGVFRSMIEISVDRAKLKELISQF
ncbi:hypothetical protein CEP51_001928 [Fusarium floridanum]|uniref:ABC transporter domain-containing protein n=1 Tax=Fusarium floridanum TaxID=1325733 RepID=A0A428SE16_9HYPO|nr:hypothetical protein CEP51_001928 [Fusarium floridanum]